MGQCHLIRFGSVGHIGRFRASDSTRYPRCAQVIIRSGRGLEVGDVLSPPHNAIPDAGQDGSILRGMTVEDHLIAVRLEKDRDKAFSACVAQLADRRISATLIDVDYLFDAETLVFYFLGDQPPELADVIEELAESYEAKVQWRSFAQAAAAGCGPGCGTDQAEGAGCGDCSTTCAVSAACSRPNA